MSNNTELFCVVDSFFLKFAATYWKFLKQSPGYPRTREGQLKANNSLKWKRTYAMVLNKFTEFEPNHFLLHS